MSYERVVDAALAETTSKFRLAEALALDIPPRKSGPTPDGEQSVLAYLEGARQAIIDAGGEPRAAGTLDHYRRTALWVSDELTRDFLWLPGVSFSAHEEGRKFGLTYLAFAAMPKHTVDFIRRATGHAGTDGQPAAIVSGWSQEERAAALRELMDDATLTEEVGVLRDVDLEVIGESASDVRLALMGMPSSERAEVIRDALADSETADAVVRVEETRKAIYAADNRHTEDVLKTAGVPDGKLTLTPQDRFARWSLTELDMDLLLTARKLKGLAKALSSRTAPIPGEYQQDMLECIADMRTSLDFAESAIRRETADWDAALSELGDQK